MGATRKKTTRRRYRLKPLPKWGLVALGLGVGILLTVLLQLLLERASAPGSGLQALVSSTEKPGPRAPKPLPAPAKPERPRYDFYTILPEIETVLPERGMTESRSAAGAGAAEHDVSYVLQAASFVKFEDADRLKAKLALNGLVPHIQKITIEGKGEYHRVRLGPYSNLDELDTANRRLQELGIRALRLKLKRDG